MKNVIITILVAIIAFIFGMVSWSTLMAYLRNYESINVDELYSMSTWKKSNRNEEEIKNQIGF